MKWKGPAERVRDFLMARGIATAPGVIPSMETVVKDFMPAQEFLLWSMSKYGSMSTFSAQIDVQEPLMELSREVVYEAPNRFMVWARNTRGFEFKSVCDGNAYAEYSNRKERPPASFPVPSSIGEASGPLMQFPRFCGSLIYMFLSRPGKLDQVADLSKSSIDYEGSIRLDNEVATIVSFYGTGKFGHVKVLIGLETGFLYRVTFDSEPENEYAHSAEGIAKLKSQLASMPMDEGRRLLEQGLEKIQNRPPSAPQWTTHIYSHAVVNGPVWPDTFGMAIPLGFSE